MGMWKFRRTTVGTAGLITAALVAWAAVSASAQNPPEPAALPLFTGTQQGPATPAGSEPLPKLEVPGTNEDPEVQPAQFRQPGRTPPGSAPRPAPGSGSTGTPVARPVADPPAPVVRIQVRVPADTPPGDDIKYVITVANVSQADAHQVTVRNPIPEGVAAVSKAEPKPDEKQTTPQQVVWTFGTLKAGQSKAIELSLKPKPDAKEVKNLAYVRFEHGEVVTTRVARPAVKIAKVAPKQTVRDEPIIVRVTVENTGKVPASKVRVVENVDRTAEFEAITTGAQQTKTKTGEAESQWEWDAGTLMPGQKKTFEYRIVPRQAGDALTTTNVSADKGVLEKAEARTKVLVPGLSMKLEGPKEHVIKAGEVAKYEITVRNTGTLPSTNIRVSGNLPADCRLTMKTEGGHVYRDSIVWTIPRLEPGEAQTFRFSLRANTSGSREVVASVIDARKVRDSREVRTLFEGAAALLWEVVPDPVGLSVGRRGTFTVRVKNNGGEAAGNVRVEVELPDAVRFEQATPSVRATGNRIVFPKETIAAKGETAYTITYEAVKSDQAWFKAIMTADALGDRPMQTEKAVEITGGGVK